MYRFNLFLYKHYTIPIIVYAKEKCKVYTTIVTIVNFQTNKMN